MDQEKYQPYVRARCACCIYLDASFVYPPSTTQLHDRVPHVHRQAFSEVVASHGASPDLSYNIALCHFRQKQYAAALKLAADIIAQGVREHPELGVGSTTGGVSVRSVGNSQLLRSTSLIEAFNLKVREDARLRASLVGR